MAPRDKIEKTKIKRRRVEREENNKIRMSKPRKYINKQREREKKEDKRQKER